MYKWCEQLKLAKELAERWNLHTTWYLWQIYGMDGYIKECGMVRVQAYAFDVIARKLDNVPGAQGVVSAILI